MCSLAPWHFPVCHSIPSHPVFPFLVRLERLCTILGGRRHCGDTHGQLTCTHSLPVVHLCVCVCLPYGPAVLVSVSWRCAACSSRMANPQAVPRHRERAEATDARWARWLVVLLVGCAVSVFVSHGVAWLAGRGSSEGEVGRLRGNQRYYFGKATRPPSEASPTVMHNDMPGTTLTGTTPFTRIVATRGLPVLTTLATTSSHTRMRSSSERACQPGLVPVTRGGLHGRLEHAGRGVNFTDKIGFRWFCSRLAAAQTPTRVV